MTQGYPHETPAPADRTWSGRVRLDAPASRGWHALAWASAVALGCWSASASAQPAKIHRLTASPTTIAWGFFDATAKPVLSMASGDSVEIETVLAAAEFLRRLGVDEKWITPEMRALDSVTDRGAGGHWLVGPVFVQSAEPGDVLEVRIKEIRLREPVAVNAFFPGGGTLPSDFPYARVSVIPLDLQAHVARFGSGVTIPLRPFFGNLGVAPPPISGRISSNPPGFHAGNLDNKELVAGTTLYIPVHVPGALFSAGDGHAGQGDGEVDGSALETALTGVFQLVVRKDLRWKWPRAETPTHLIAMGFSGDLDEAARHATRELIEFVRERYHLSAEDAYMLASAAADLRVTQLVDGVKGIHAMLPKGLFRTP